MRYTAITGGIGSGKSYVCRVLARHGISVYDSDAAAKRLYATDPALHDGLVRLVGDSVYSGTVLQKRVLAQFLLQSEANKQAVNDLVHPAVARDFMASGMAWLESAILFDSGFYRRVPFSFTVCVAAPLETRVERVMQRDGIERDKALEWIARQWPQDKVAARCDFVIQNDGLQDLEPQVERLIAEINRNTNKL